MIRGDVVAHASKSDGVLLTRSQAANTEAALAVGYTTFAVLSGTHGKHTLLGDRLARNGGHTTKGTEGHTGAVHSDLQGHTFLHSHTRSGLLELVLLQLVLQEVLAGEQLTKHKGTVLAGHLVVVVTGATQRQKHTFHVLVLLYVIPAGDSDLVYNMNAEGRELLVGEVQTVRGGVEHVTLLDRLQSVG